MKSLLLKVPDTTDIYTLSQEVVAAIQIVNGQWVWYEKKVGGFGLLDCIVLDSFEPYMLAIAPGWELLGMWQWDCVTPYYQAYIDDENVLHQEQNPCIVLAPVSLSAIQFLPDHVAYDANGNEISRITPTEWYESLRWSGWPPRSAI